MSEVTTGGLLGGRVTYRQLRTGNRTGFEPVLLAAAIPARTGQIILDAGTGAGAALLCLATRIPGITGIGVERDADTAELANENFRINNLQDVFCIQADAVQLPFVPRIFDHVMANPPWFTAAGTISLDSRRALAHQAAPNLLPNWVASLVAVLRIKGSITLILPAASFAVAAAALRATGCGAIILTPLWPRAGEPPKMIIISARYGVKIPDTIHPGLILHDGNAISPAAQTILRDGAALA